MWLKKLFAFACGECNGWVIAYPEPGGECRLEAKSLVTGLTLSYELNCCQAIAIGGNDGFACDYQLRDGDGDLYPAYRRGSWRDMLELLELEPELRPERGQIHLCCPDDLDS